MQRLQNFRWNAKAIRGKREKRQDGMLRETGIEARNGACSSSDLSELYLKIAARVRGFRDKGIRRVATANIKIY